MENRSFLIYLRNKTTLKFEYRSDVKTAISSDKGFHITFFNGSSYIYGKDKVKYYPLLCTKNDVYIYLNGSLNNIYNTVDDYGHYLVLRNGKNCSLPIENSGDIEICKKNKDISKSNNIIAYFKEILKTAGEISFNVPDKEITNNISNQISSEILLKALDKIDLLNSKSALSAYLNGETPLKHKYKSNLIFPFGCNESQKLAVETSLGNQISIIEGPPGTGKTQTILNIIANLIIQDKTVAIVSNNNSAVFNVKEKLQKYGYQMIAASLGNNENKTLFFDNDQEQSINPNYTLSKERFDAAKNEIQSLDSILTNCFQQRNKLAKLKTNLSDAKTQFEHLKLEQPLSEKIELEIDRKIPHHWSISKALKKQEMISVINVEGKLSIKQKLRLIFEFGPLCLKYINKYRDEFPIYLNHKFYDIYITKIESEINDIENWLANNNEISNLKAYVNTSEVIFKGKLFKKYNSLKRQFFNTNDYRNRFDDFIKHYPVVLSSTLSLHSSIPKGYLFDYMIIDEASQVDIIKSSVCFSCCKNVIVVGDSMQLTHIVDNKSKESSELFQNSYNISPAYDYVKQNIINSLKTLYGNRINSIILKEHYRCHPSIIGFCNKKYYNNNLVVMTESKNNPFKIIETNISGSRDKYNQRQIYETDSFIRKNYSSDFTKIGVIAPYRNHADLLINQLPPGVEADTIHKFQGREKEVIIFNTVSNKIDDFIDNPNLINVAVSRAVKDFIIVKSESMELPHGSNLGDLIRYICYTSDPNETIIKGSICSVFDLLYKEYNQALTSFLSTNKGVYGSAAEIIIYELLNKKILPNNPQYACIDLVREYRLRDLIRDLKDFSDDEVNFIKNNSRIDFLLYNKIDKTPVLAIEVDGVSFHDNAIQQERDKCKNNILKIIGLPLLRLSTAGYNEEEKIMLSLNSVMGIN